MTKEQILNEFREVTGINEAKKIYKKLAKVLHPDVGGSEEEFKLLNEIYNHLIENKIYFSNDFKIDVELEKVISTFRNVSQEINTSSSRFGESQNEFSKHSNQFLQNNSNTITEIQKSLETAKSVSADYAQKFEIIEKGLQDIFGKITTGLKDYQATVSGSLETYLGKYTDALTKTAESLAGASSKQEDILEELTEQLSKLNGRRN